MFNSLAVMVAIGPAALATLLEPIEKATYNDITKIKPLIKGFLLTLVDLDMVNPLRRIGR